MTSVTEYTQLKQAVDDKRAAADRASGAFDQALAELKKKFKVSSLEEAKEKLEQFEKEEAVARKAYEKALEQFKEEWKDVFGDLTTQG